MRRDYGGVVEDHDDVSPVSSKPSLKTAKEGARKRMPPKEGARKRAKEGAVPKEGARHH